MEKFIPYEKMSKKKKKEINQKKRSTWNGLNPITRKSKNLKIYNRKKVLKWNDETFQDIYFYSVFSGTTTQASAFLWSLKTLSMP